MFVFLQISILKNINSDASILSHDLNKSEDSLIISCECNISKIEIIKDGIRDRIEVNEKSKTVGLYGLEKGRYSVAVFIPKKIVMFHLMVDKKKPIIRKELDWIKGSNLPLFPIKEFDIKIKTTLHRVRNKAEVKRERQVSIDLDSYPFLILDIDLLRGIVVVDVPLKYVQTKFLQEREYQEKIQTKAYPMKDIKLVNGINLIPTPKKYIPLDNVEDLVDFIDETFEDVYIEPTIKIKNNKFQIPEHLLENDLEPIQWYWVKYDTDQNFSSKKAGFIAKQSTVDYLIKKNLYDRRTITGRYNYVKVLYITDLELWRNSNKLKGFQKEPYYKTK